MTERTIAASAPEPPGACALHIDVLVAGGGASGGGAAAVVVGVVAVAAGGAVGVAGGSSAASSVASGTAGGSCRTQRRRLAQRAGAAHVGSHELASRWRAPLFASKDSPMQSAASSQRRSP